MRKKLTEAFDRKDGFRYIDLYSLPKDFRTASFDYHMCAYRHAGECIAVLIDKERFAPAEWSARIEKLKRLMSFREGEIFEFGRREHPIFYLDGDEPASSLETFRMIRKF